VARFFGPPSRSRGKEGNRGNGLPARLACARGARAASSSPVAAPNARPAACAGGGARRAAGRRRTRSPPPGPPLDDPADRRCKGTQKSAGKTRFLSFLPFLGSQEGGQKKLAAA